MTYDVLGRGPLDYLPCRYGTSKLMFRGPKRDLTDPYIAFVGTTETYGKFILHPFPTLVEQALGTTCVNFGQITAGVDAFATDPFVTEAASAAEVTVVQIMGAQNMTNRFYAVHPRRNDRFLSAATILQTIYRDVDFSDFHFNKHMLSYLCALSPERFDAVVQELREAWSARMGFLLSQIKGKCILLWLSDHAPMDEGPVKDVDLGKEPLFITRQMVEALREKATVYVEVVASKNARLAGTQGMVYSDLDAPAAEKMLNPIVHAQAADALTDAIQNLRSGIVLDV